MKYCPEYAVLLSSFSDGECTPEEARQVQEHLSSCEGCRAYLQQLLLLKDAFPDEAAEEVPDDFAAGVMAAVRADAAPRPAEKRLLIRTLLPMAACFAVVIALVQGGVPGSRKPAPMQEAAQTAAATENRDGGALPAEPECGAASDSVLDVGDTPGSTQNSGCSAAPKADSAPLRLALTPEQEQNLLGVWSCTVDGDTHCYALPQEAFDALCEELEQRRLSASSVEEAKEQAGQDASLQSVLITVEP